MTTFALKDSGKRQEFNTGAVRDTQDDKGRYDLLPPHALRRVAQVFQRGAEKYAERNWEKGIPVSRYMDSALRHTFAALDRQEDEDHLGQAAWNILCAIQTQYWANNGTLPAGLDDLPRRDTGPRVVDLMRDGPEPADVDGSVNGPVERIYIAGPYTATTPEEVAANVARAASAAAAVMARGHDAHCPHTATHAIALLNPNMGYERWMRLDFGIIQRWATGILVLAPSPGTIREIDFATRWNLKVYRSIGQIPDIA